MSVTKTRGLTRSLRDGRHRRGLFSSQTCVRADALSITALVGGDVGPKRMFRKPATKYGVPVRACQPPKVGRWCENLHSEASIFCRLLDLPPYHLVHSDANGDCDFVRDPTVVTVGTHSL